MMVEMPEIVLDLTRLASRLRHITPTGVDRVEMAYARELLRRVPDRLRFGLHHPVAGYGRLPRDAVLRFLDATAAAWEASADQGTPARRGAVALAGTLAALRPRPVPRTDRRRILIQASPSKLHQRLAIARKLARENAALVVLLHDLIPIEFPEYARPGGREIHIARMETVAALADGVIANSSATLRAFTPFLERAGRHPACAVALLGTDQIATTARAAATERPYFVCIGTIEPRKNHLLLLHLWRQLATEYGAAHIPRLLVIGRRGWENEQVVDLLERAPALAGCVEEHGGLRDGEVRALIAGARALLLPSFAEGFGMPVPEALSLGTPVICSDLPALREAGGRVPLYLDPLDAPGWRRAVLDMADPAGLERPAQLERLARWHVPTWAEHLAIVLDMADRRVA